jgi:hypothetical protein
MTSIVTSFHYKEILASHLLQLSAFYTVQIAAACVVVKANRLNNKTGLNMVQRLSTLKHPFKASLQNSGF